ncbi:hypothetical protein [Nocardiopsis gilva]|uniref:hypothetical protein n=1 Tax=Nocardiopsis gilva TaxID=280236 RepID=UPI0012FE5E85
MRIGAGPTPARGWLLWDDLAPNDIVGYDLDHTTVASSDLDHPVLPGFQHTDDIPEAAVGQLDAQSGTPTEVVGCHLGRESRDETHVIDPPSAHESATSAILETANRVPDARRIRVPESRHRPGYDSEGT